jgi:hypothetical protein
MNLPVMQRMLIKINVCEIQYEYQVADRHINEMKRRGSRIF